MTDRMRSEFSVVLLIALLLPCRAFSLDPPYLTAGLDTRRTDNLFQDSTQTGDMETSLYLDMDQPLLLSLMGVYSGEIRYIRENTGMSSLINRFGLDYMTLTDKYQEFWISPTFEMVRYHRDYDIYSYQDMVVEGGFGFQLPDYAKLAIQGRVAWFWYPFTQDTLSVDYSERSATVTFQAAVPRFPVSWEIEGGFQSRSYPGIKENPVSDMFSLFTGISASLGTRTGFRLESTVQDQVNASTATLYRLWRNGIDPANILWDGWIIDTRIKHLVPPWSFIPFLEWYDKNYIELSILSLRDERHDRGFQAGLMIDRIFERQAAPFTTWVRFSISYLKNNSTDPFYSFSEFPITLGIVIEPVF